MCWIFYLENPSFAIVIEASDFARCFNHRFWYLCIYFSWYIQNHQNPLSILAFFTPFVILCLSKICRFTAYILTIVKKMVAHNTSHYLFAILNWKATALVEAVAICLLYYSARQIGICLTDYHFDSHKFFCCQQLSHFWRLQWQPVQ